jgi:hypothetical protein
MVEEHREIQGLSIRALAKETNIPAGTIFNWVRAKTGHPPASSYTEAVNGRLAYRLEIHPNELWQAFKASLTKRKPAPVPAPKSQKNPAPAMNDDPVEYRTTPNLRQRLLSMLRVTGKQTFTLEEIETILALLGD